MSDSTSLSPKPCPYCGQRHSTVCSLIKAFEYHSDGTLKRVEFKTAADNASTAGEKSLFERVFGSGGNI